MNEQDRKRRAQIVYFSHGGGPLPILGDPSHQAMVEFMKKLPSMLRRPTAIIVVSAHWEEKVPTILGSGQPDMLYDYYGFPEESYKIKYPASGDTALAKKTAELLKSAGFDSSVDNERGFDHGLYIPLMLMYPEADIPSVQLSLVKGLDAQTHIELGKALRPLLDEDVLIIGSGFSFHNMREFTMSADEEIDQRNDDFQNRLIEICTVDANQADREAFLADWESAPNARYCHPREEHLLPLHVCAAMGGSPAELVFHDYIAGKRAVAFMWK